MAEIVKDLDFWRFAAMGMFVKTVLWGGKREPDAYLYNGVRLPDIYKVYPPELQKEYPYAWIDGFLAPDFYDLYVSRSAPVVETQPGGNQVIPSGGTDKDEWVSSEFRKDTGVWGEMFNAAMLSFADYIFWTNCDIQNPDGSVFLAASEPIPVYE